MAEISLANTIFDSMTDGVITLDHEGTITAMNPSACQVLGIAAEAAVGSSYAEVFFMLPENDEFNQLLLDLAGAQDNPYAEVSFTREDGSRRQLALTTSLLKDDDGGGDQRRGAVLVFKDITAIQQLRDQRDQLQAELAAKHEELKDAYRDLEGRNKNLEEAQKRVLWIKLGAGVLGALLFIGLLIYYQFFATSSGGDSKPVKEVAAFSETTGSARGVTADRGDIIVSVSCRGFIEPLELLTVTSEVAGKVVVRKANLGLHVNKGDVLFMLDPAELLPKVRQAEASALENRQTFNELESWKNRPEFKQAQRALDLARMDTERKKARAEENERLFKAGIIPKNDLIDSHNDYRRAMAELASAEERLFTATEKASRGRVKVAKLKLMNAEAEMKELQAKLDATVVRAPVSGVVMLPATGEKDKQSRIPELGEKVSEGQALVVLGADQPLGVQTKVDEVAVRKIKVGQKALISGHALPRTFEGVVRSVAPQAEISSRVPVFPVLIELKHLPPEEAQEVRLGMSASVRIVVTEVTGAVRLPVLAVADHDGAPAVRVSKNGKYEWQPVETGVSDRNFVQIKKGVEPGQEVYY